MGSGETLGRECGHVGWGVWRRWVGNVETLGRKLVNKLT